MTPNTNVPSRSKPWLWIAASAFLFALFAFAAACNSDDDDNGDDGGNDSPTATADAADDDDSGGDDDNGGDGSTLGDRIRDISNDYEVVEAKVVYDFTASGAGEDFDTQLTLITRPPSVIVRPTLVVYAKTDQAFLFVPRESAALLKVELAPRLARLLILLEDARTEDGDVLAFLRGYRSQAVLREEYVKRQWSEVIVEDSTITEYVFLIRQAIAREVELLPAAERGSCFDPIQNKPRVGYRSTPPGLVVYVLQQ